ncbi:hypothetical protein [Piscinibacter terrae]|uniref:hypothetical protein n=1 Tax=Piscinibacter terrae TaxID=2496871 RepID=UPI001386848E|nr:hypothetical protein [Albitalea terrae]
MDTLKLDAPLTVKEPVVLVDPKLPVGTYRVQLVVQGATGKSQAADLLIKVFKE